MAGQSKLSLSPFGHATSGAASSVIALLLIYPLDTIKTRLQVQTKKSHRPSPYGLLSSLANELSSILSEEGVEGLYAGLGSNLLNQMVTGFSYFFCHSLLHSRYYKSRGLRPNTRLSTATELVLGAVAGMLSQIFTLPVSVIATRQQTDAPSERKSIAQTTESIIQEDGILGLWRGFKPSMLLCVNPAITYGVFERLKSAVLDKRSANSKKATYLTSGEAFVIAAISKTLATVITYPYIMAKVRLQWKPSKQVVEECGGDVVYKSTMDVLGKTWNKSGIAGLYQGMQLQIFKAVLTQALLLMLKERLNLHTAMLFNAFKKLSR
ncbi:hypothetical protein H4219_001818 [Mycoemilia scoparia]|uniref:Mitochondrial carrier n=1 Tax=Mycoemilia scoparia TaxID=417184 RepID=A0A9W8DPW9_9FUNG|nr:hypothetical protein H4219_001818 [Mycoemilia scoparia]